jgi:uncharacterized protein (TIGR03067 family)
MTTEAEVGGNKVPEQFLRGNKWTFDGNRVTITDGRSNNVGVFTLDSKANPKTFDVKGQTGASMGIYELSGDTLKICMSPKQRPATFNSKDTQFSVYYLLKRAPN